MSILTRSEEANYSLLTKEGHGELAELYRSHRLRDHETFEKLSKADLTAVYGPTISDEWISAMRKTIASGDHTLVRPMHEYLLTLKAKNEEPASPERQKSRSGLFSGGNSAIIWWTLSAVLVLIGLFMGS